MKYYICDICRGDFREGQISRVKHSAVNVDMCHECYTLFNKAMRLLTIGKGFREEIDKMYIKFFGESK